MSDGISERAQARLGAVLKQKWKLDRVLGIGGMAVVYSATHRNQSRVAIKMLHPEVAVEAEVTQRFLREGYVANTVGHPGTVRVLDDDTTEDGAPFLVMELLEGETLDARWLRKGERLPEQEVVTLFDQVLDVLAAAHGRGIVHRDLKPENLFLTTEGRVKVLDFGIARLRELSRDRDVTTQAGSLLGTPAFMSPEQARGRWDDVDGRTDIWAVGATMHALLTGRFVHEAETVNEQLIFAATRPPRPIAEVQPELSTELASIVDRALTFEKSERWSDASAMQSALRRAYPVLNEARSTLLPVPSVVQPHEAPTLMAASAPTPSVRAETLTTARPITRSAELAAPPARRRALLGVGVAAAVVGAAVAVGLVVSGGRPEPVAAPASETPPSAPKAAASVAQPAGPAVAVGPAVSAEVPGPPAAAPAEPVASVAPRHPPARGGPVAGASAAPPKPPKPPAVSTTAAPPPTSTASLWDRRH
ncbi:MAG: protein kinase [Polyangiaceae bacterium]|nr:protein kinase [Polyangiaceae bacterium]